MARPKRRYAYPSGGRQNNDVNIGKPFSNVSIYILDKSLNLLPIGAQEVCMRANAFHDILTGRSYGREVLPNPFAEGEKCKTEILQDGIPKVKSSILVERMI